MGREQVQVRVLAHKRSIREMTMLYLSQIQGRDIPERILGEIVGRWVKGKTMGQGGASSSIGSLGLRNVLISLRIKR